MMRPIFFLVLLPVAFVLAGCSSSNTPQQKTDEGKTDKKATDKPGDSSRASRDKSTDTPRPTEKPTPPLQLAVPAAMPEKLDGKSLKTLAAGELIGRANQAMGKSDYTKAATYQYWYVQKTKTGQYNLACFLAQIGQTDPSFYWLQQAAIEEGVDTEHTQQDEDLASLRSDPRWAKVHQYLADCNRYFETAPIGRTTLILPKGYKKGTPIPAVVWMRGLGSRPEDFVNEGCQEYYPGMKVAQLSL